MWWPVRIHLLRKSDKIATKAPKHKISRNVFVII